jgi:hypothetical protein
MKSFIRKQIAKMIGIGYLKIVHNKERAFGSNRTYIHLKAIRENGNEVDMLFTEDDLKVAKNRAENNKEDYA